MKKKKAFTLVELLAVIVILAIILVIAVPKIANTIKNARKGSIESTAKLIAGTAETKYQENQILENNDSITCAELANLNDTDYGSCSVTVNSVGVATVTISGKTGGKFEGITCTGTKNNMTCTEGDTEPEYVYAFGDISDASEGVEDYRDLKDWNNNQQPVFIKFKSDLSEKYVCTMYDSAASNGLGTEPHCLLSANAYSTRNEANSEWSQVVDLFGATNCSEELDYETCDTNISSFSWHCGASSDRVSCSSDDHNSITECVVSISGAYCEIRWR